MPIETPVKHQPVSDWMSGLKDTGYDPAAQPAKEAIVPPAAVAPPVVETEPDLETDATKPPVVTEAVKQTKKAELSPDEETAIQKDIESGKWPRSADQWEKYKLVQKKQTDEAIAGRSEFEKKFAAANTELEKLRASPAKPADYEDAIKERDELSERVKQISVENHPRFKSYFENKTNAQYELAKRVVGTELSEQVVKVLKMADGESKDMALEEIMAGLTTTKQAQLAGVNNSLSLIEDERQGEIKKAVENYASIQEKTKNQIASQRKQLESDVDSKIKSMQKDNPAFQMRDGDVAWNDGVAKRIESAKALIFGGKDRSAAMDAAFHASAYPFVLEASIELAKQVKKLESQVKELSGATPKIDSGGDSGKAPAPAPKKVGQRPMDAIDEWTKNLPGWGGKPGQSE